MAKSFARQRIQQILEWASKASLPGMSQDTYVQIFDHVLSHQQIGGNWNLPGRNWDVAMTSVVLKSLSALHFSPTDTWQTVTREELGVAPALIFLTREVLNAREPALCGEDLWDGCQATLALKQFGLSSGALTMVRQINANWESLYRAECSKAIKPNRWCGPAYLASMIDVMAAYESDLLANSNFVPALAHLITLESLNGAENTDGFKSTYPREDINIWTTALVLRTLCTVPPQHANLIDRSQIQRLTAWLLAQLAGNPWSLDEGEAPMFLARSLHALYEAQKWIGSDARRRVIKTLELGNHTISEFFSLPQRVGDLKAYTAVVEYLAAWKTPAPIGLIFHAKRGLEAAAQAFPSPREGGLRIAWLSDLHVAAKDERIPFSLNPAKHWAGRFMQYLNTPLTQHFQLRNVETILDRVKAIAPDHILVTGDVTNFAHGSQFSSVHNLFLGLQAAFTGVPSGKLSGELWTVLPGNHDVTDEQSGGDLVRSHLGMFFRTFGSTYDPVPVPGRYDDAFPLTKLIVGRGRSSMTIRVIGLDSTVSAPVWKIGVNARGRIDDRQMERLNNIVGPHPSADLTLIAVHHHPVVIPHLVSELEDHFLSLDEKAGRQLIKLSANTGVSAILHGHFHHFSSWSVLTPQGRHMAIIGSPAGTLNIPDTYEQFLELREADRETSDGVQHGLAIYSHRRNAANDWDETYTGIFLPCL